MIPPGFQVNRRSIVEREDNPHVAIVNGLPLSEVDEAMWLMIESIGIKQAEVEGLFWDPNGTLQIWVK